MRVTLLLCALLPFTAVASARADDEPAKAPPSAVAPFALTDILPPAGTRPSGWDAVDGTQVIPATAPTAGRLFTLAKAAGIEAAHVDARCLPLQQGAGDDLTAAVAGWLAVDADIPAFAKALTAAAEKHGWTVRPLGSPHRLAVSWGATEEARDAVIAWQAETAVRSLCDLAFTTMAKAEDRDTFRKGMMQLGSAQRIDAKAGPVLFMQGRVLMQNRQGQRALGAWRAALAEDVTIKMPDRWTVIAAYQVAQAMLTAGQQDILPEALRILRVGVAAEASSEEHIMRFGNRYNLACAYARLGKKDEAFEHLEESLRFLKEAWDRVVKEGGEAGRLDFPMNLEHARSKDPDMDSLRSDERWAALMAKYTQKPKDVGAPEVPKTPKKDG